MNVLVAGATGALGVPTVRALLATGKHVVGTTRSESKRASIEAAGAGSLVMDAFDRDSIARAVEQSSPDVVIELLTRLPAAPMRASDLEGTSALRTQGTENVLAAIGRARLIGESVAFYYGSGAKVFTENDPIPDQRRPQLRPAAFALREHERLVREANGIVLRFGLFYGPETASSRSIAKGLRRRVMPVISGGRGVLPWIHVEDAASAVVAVVDRGKDGEVYNIVDDRALSIRETFDAFAEAVGTRKPWSIPKPLARLGAPYPAEFMTWNVRVSNAKAKSDLGWSPRYPTVREGAETLVGL